MYWTLNTETNIWKLMKYIEIQTGLTIHVKLTKKMKNTEQK